MKKIIAIAFAAILACFAISCQKEEAISDKTDAVQYTFNITVNGQVGFDNDASTKGGGSATYKSAWENGDKIFLFFKPADGSLLDDIYATLTYNGSSWDGTVSPGQSILGDGGTLTAVYVYKLGSDEKPEYSSTNSKWTIATGNAFYNCQIEVPYTVSGSEISASLNLVAPADFVQFYVGGATGVLTCSEVKGWKDVAIASDMTVGNVTCTGYMDGFSNSGDSEVKEYYGRIVSGTSLDGVNCKFSVVKNGKVYERTATPSSDAKSFSMNTSATGDKEWREEEGKLPGLFTVGKGADNTAGTADDVIVRFSQGNLVASINESGTPTAWKFATNQYDCLGEGGANKTIGNTSTSGIAGDVDLFGWSASKDSGTSTTDNYGIMTSTTSSDYSGDFYDWGVAYCASKSISPDNTWRSLSIDEWKYLFNTRTMANGGARYENLISSSITVESVIFKGVVLFPDNFTEQATWKDTYTTWEALNNAGLVFLPAAGFREGSNVKYVDGSRCYYWSSYTPIPPEEMGPTVMDQSYRWLFHSGGLNPQQADRYLGHSVRLITESN